MSQADPINNMNALVEVPVKRKRGRPRKYPKAEETINRLSQRNPSSKRGENGTSRRQENRKDDVIVGQPVYGVVEGEFGEGYLIAVRVENSNTVLRGAVFKTSVTIPVSEENDVVPNLPMIKRTETPFPKKSYSNENANPEPAKSESANPISTKGKEVCLRTKPSFQQVAVNNNSSIVPLVIQPLHLATMPPHLVASKKKLVLESESSQPRVEIPGLPFEELQAEVLMRVQDPVVSDDQVSMKFPGFPISGFESTKHDVDHSANSSELRPDKFDELMKALQQELVPPSRPKLAIVRNSEFRGKESTASIDRNELS